MADLKTQLATPAHAEESPKAKSDTKKAAKPLGSLDAGYAALADKSATRADLESAIDAAQTWQLPNPHPQDARYTVPAKHQLIRDLQNRLKALG